MTKRNAKTKKTVSVEKPVLEEQTKAQIAHRTGVAAMLGYGTLASSPKGKYLVYRKMRTCPTISIARVAATAPILTANWALEADDNVPDDRVKFVQRQLDHHYPRLIKDMLFALDYGWQPFEKVWTVKDNQYVYDKIKMLVVDKSVLLLEKNTGAFKGIRNEKTVLEPANCFVFTHDSEGTDLYGRSRHENVRENAWFPWTEILDRTRHYAKKGAGVVPMIEYPPGTSKDQDGSTQSNFQLSRDLLEALGKVKGITMPNTLAAHATDLIRAGVDLEQLKAWRVSFLETKAGHGREFSMLLRYFDVLMLRGWLVPERAATEGQFGTKAEAVVHTQLALTMSDLLYQDMLRQINSYIINPLLVLNFGAETADSIRLKREGLDPVIVSWLREMLTKVLTTPVNTDLFFEFLDIDTILDQTGLPKSAETVSSDDIRNRSRMNKQIDDDENGKGSKLSMSRALQSMYSNVLSELNDNKHGR